MVSLDDLSRTDDLHPWVAEGLRLAIAKRDVVASAIESSLPSCARVDAASSWCLWRAWSRANWLRCAFDPKRETQDRALSFKAFEIDSAVAALANCRSGIVLTVPHAGDYLHLLIRVLSGMHGRKILLARRRPPSRLDSAVLGKLAQLGLDCELVVSGVDAALRLARALRQGAVAVLMFDLPERWGATSAVSFLGASASFVCGPSVLATRTESVVLPVYAMQEPSGPVGLLGEVLLPESAGDQAAEALAVNQTLATELARFVACAPDQWHHWNLMPQFRGCGD